jgi:PAS domain S-box-containing protein
MATSPAGLSERRLILTLCLIMIGATAAAYPIANLQFQKIPSVVSFQGAVVILTDGITALLLFQLFVRLRLRSLLILGNAYFFCALIAVAQFLTFPDILPGLPVNPAVSSWLWIAWHFGFGLAGLAYLLAECRWPAVQVPAPRRAVAISAVAVAGLVGLLCLALIAVGDWLPKYFINGDGEHIRAWWSSGLCGLGLSIFAIAMAGLLRSRRHWTVLNCWFAFSLTAYACELFCVQILSSRYTLYWFFARLDSVMASSVVLALLLSEISRVYRRLAESTESLTEQVAECTVELSGMLDLKNKVLAERNRIEEEVRARERIYRAIGESVDYGVWICAPDGRNTYASPSFLKLVGLSQKQCSDFGWGDVLHPDDARRTIAAWHECVRNESIWDIEHRFRGVDGQWHWVLARGVPVRDEAGKIVCWAGINLDISRIKQTEEELQIAKTSAEKANDAKSHFLAAASHDLRQPFQALRLYLDILNQQLDDPGNLKVAQMASAALSLGEGLLHTLLDVSKWEAGLVKIQRGRVSFSEITEDLLAQCAGLARQKGLELTIVGSSMVLDSDPALLSRLLRNLVDNAIKYTERGRILLGCRRVKGCARIEVWDTGIGIADDQQERIFDDFYQVGNTGRDQNLGLGIGLGVVRRTAETLGHRITLCSRPGRGSVFAVTVNRCSDLTDEAPVLAGDDPVELREFEVLSS